MYCIMIIFHRVQTWNISQYGIRRLKIIQWERGQQGLGKYEQNIMIRVHIWKHCECLSMDACNNSVIWNVNKILLSFCLWDIRNKRAIDFIIAITLWHKLQS
jgi:hypothetical protein